MNDPKDEDPDPGPLPPPDDDDPSVTDDYGLSDDPSNPLSESHSRWDSLDTPGVPTLTETLPDGVAFAYPCAIFLPNPESGAESISIGFPECEPVTFAITDAVAQSIRDTIALAITLAESNASSWPGAMSGSKPN